MKTFKQFLLEETEDPKEIADLIWKDCQPFLKESGFQTDGDFVEIGLFRGLKHLSETFSKVESRTRGPSDSNLMVHNTLNGYLKKKFGIPYRSEGTFASGYQATARSYGSTYLIFPIGNFSYAWDKNIIDAFNFFDDTGWPDLGSKIPIPPSLQLADGYVNTKDPAWGELMSNYLEEHNCYIDTGLNDALTKHKRTEVMIHCKSYYALEYSSFKSYSKVFAGQVFDALKELSNK